MIDGSLTVMTYVAYVCVTLAATWWVARTLSKNGYVFLVNALGGDEKLAQSVNHLLVVGFYLINLGYVCLQLKLGSRPQDFAESIEMLSVKVGLVLLVLGGMHFMNLFLFTRFGRRENQKVASH